MPRNSQVHKNRARIFNRGLHFSQKHHRFSAVDQTMVVRERNSHHRSYLNLKWANEIYRALEFWRNDKFLGVQSSITSTFC